MKGGNEKKQWNRAIDTSLIDLSIIFNIVSVVILYLFSHNNRHSPSFDFVSIQN